MTYFFFRRDYGVNYQFGRPKSGNDSPRCVVDINGNFTVAECASLFDGYNHLGGSRNRGRGVDLDQKVGSEENTIHRLHRLRRDN